MQAASTIRSGAIRSENNPVIHTTAAAFKQDVRAILQTSLQSSLVFLFQQADESLLALIEHSNSDSDREICFDTLHNLHTYQETLSAEYLHRCLQAFDDSIHDGGTHSAAHPSDLSLSIHDFNLSDDEGLAVDIAISNIKQRCHAENRMVLQHLAERFGKLLSRSLDVHSFPLAPEHLCAGLPGFISGIRANSPVKLLTLKLFDRFATPSWNILYQQVERLFIEQGVESTAASPNASHKVLSRRVPNAGGLSEKIPRFNCDNTVLQVLQELLYTPSVLADSEDEPKIQRTLSTPELLEGLSELQAEEILRLDSRAAVRDESIKSRLLRHCAASSWELQSADEQIMDIVSMLFQYISVDATIPAELTTLLARLHIPFMKQALLEPSIFKQASHPAKNLLNELAFSVAHLQKSSEKPDPNDPVLQAVLRAVTRVCVEYTDNSDIFAAITTEFQDSLVRINENQRAVLQYQDHVKDEVVQLIKRKLHLQPVPTVIEGFIRHAWYAVLTVIGTRDKRAGKAWDDGVRLLDDLIWSVQPKQLAQERDLLLKMIPGLLNRLQEGLCFIQYSQTHLNRFFEHMQHIHIRCLNGLSAQSSEPNQTPQSPRSSAALNTQSGKVIDDVAADLSFGLPVTDELRNSAQYPLVEKLVPGIWVEFGQGNQRRHGQLFWRNEYTGEFQFIDRAYQLVQELEITELVSQFEQAQARIGAEAPLFTRAIGAVLNRPIFSFD